MTSVKLLHTVHTDTGFHTDLWPRTHRTLISLTILSGVSCKKVHQTHTAKQILTRWNIGWFRCGQSWTTDIITAAIGQWRRRLGAPCDTCVKAQGDILNNICVEFTCSPLACLLNSRPV